MINPSLSIITTSLNRRSLLRKTLDSVLVQQYPAIEQLVMDGGSTDGTIELLREYEPKFQRRGYPFRWLSEKDSGQGEAMNKGLRIAGGDYLTILNSDDFLSTNGLDYFMSTLARYPTIDFIYGNHDTIYADGRRATINHRQYSLADILYRAYQIPQSSAIFRRSFIDIVGGFDESLHFVAEHELFLRIVKAGVRPFYLPVVLQVTVEHPQRKATADARQGWQETKKINFRHGCGYWSRFYLLYLKGVYLNWLFDPFRKRLPEVYGMVKYVFNKIV